MHATTNKTPTGNSQIPTNKQLLRHHGTYPETTQKSSLQHGF